MVKQKPAKTGWLFQCPAKISTERFLRLPLAVRKVSGILPGTKVELFVGQSPVVLMQLVSDALRDCFSLIRSVNPNGALYLTQRFLQEAGWEAGQIVYLQGYELGVVYLSKAPLHEDFAQRLT